MVILLLWAFVMTGALVGSVYTTVERRSIRDTAGALWITAVGPFLGAGLMIDSLILACMREPARHTVPSSIFVAMAALLGVVLGPMGFVEGLRHAHPLHAPAHVNVTRALFVAAWAIATFAAVLHAVSG